jgi:hypothetical protein
MEPLGRGALEENHLEEDLGVPLGDNLRVRPRDTLKGIPKGIPDLRAHAYARGWLCWGWSFPRGAVFPRASVDLGLVARCALERLTSHSQRENLRR